MGGSYNEKKSTFTVDVQEISELEEQTISDARRRYNRNAFYIVLNIASALSLTYLNKIVVANDQLEKCQVLFASYSFATTFVVLLIATLPPFNMFPRVRVPFLSILPLCILFAGFLLLGNLSLRFNDMAVYSLARLMTCPTVVVLNYLLFRNSTAKPKILAVVVLTSGVMIASGQIGVAKPIGGFIAVLGFIVTALYQLVIGRQVINLKVSPPQLLLNQAPIAALLLLAIVPMADTLPDLSLVPHNVRMAALGAGIAAPIFNISQFLIIGSTSALTFNVMGMAKLVGTLIMGWTLTQRYPNAIELIGVSLALSGTWLYAARGSPNNHVREILQPRDSTDDLEQGMTEKWYDDGSSSDGEDEGVLQPPLKV